MGMALPDLRFDEQYGTGNLQAEKTLPSVYSPPLQRRRETGGRTKLHLWGLAGRWMMLPVYVRRILAAALVVGVLGSFSAAAKIQSVSAKDKFEKVYYSQSCLQDRLDEINSISTRFGKGTH